MALRDEVRQSRLGWAGRGTDALGLAVKDRPVAFLYRFGPARIGWARQSRIGLAQQVKDWRGSVLFGSHGSASRVKAMRCTVRLGAAVSDGQRIAMVGSGSVRLGAVRLGSLG